MEDKPLKNQEESKEPGNQQHPDEFSPSEPSLQPSTPENTEGTDKYALLAKLASTKTISRTNKELEDDVAEVTRALKKWKGIVQSMKEGADSAAKSLAKVAELMEAAKIFSKVSFGLAFASAGLGHLLSFLGDDPNKAILDAIGKVADTIDEFREETRMRFDQLKDQGHWDHALTRIDKYKVDLKAALDLFHFYNEAVIQKDSNKKKVYESKLNNYGSSKIFIAVEGISEQVIDKKDSPGIFQAMHNNSHGDLQSMIDLGVLLIMYAVNGLAIDALIGRIMMEREHPELKEEDIVLLASDSAQELHQPLIKNIIERFEFWKNECLKNLATNVDSFVNAEKYTLPGDNYRLVADYVKSVAAKKWFWLDWTVLVYSPVSTQYQHMITGHNYKAYNQVNAKGGQFNLVIHWTPKDHQSHPKFPRERRGPESIRQLAGIIFRLVEPPEFLWVGNFLTISDITEFKMAETKPRYQLTSFQSPYPIYRFAAFTPRGWRIPGSWG